MLLGDILQLYKESPQTQQIISYLKNKDEKFIGLSGIAGSSLAMVAASVYRSQIGPFVFVMSDKEEAAYFFNDMESVLGEKGVSYENRSIFFLPSSFKKTHGNADVNNANVLLRSEVINRLSSETKKFIVVTYPEGISEKVVSRKILKKNTLVLNQGEPTSIDFIVELLNEYGFEKVDFVVEPGQFSLRGGIVDVFSYSNDFPYRIEVFGDNVESLRWFNPETQTSIEKLQKVSILPDINSLAVSNEKEDFFSLLPSHTVFWHEDVNYAKDIIEKLYDDYNDNNKNIAIESLYISNADYVNRIQEYFSIEFRKIFLFKGKSVEFDTSPQPAINKNFNILIDNLKKNTENRYKNVLLSENQKQIERLKNIFENILSGSDDIGFEYSIISVTVHEGFVDHSLKIACYTDHQIFERYHRYQLRDKFPAKQSITIKELNSLKPGDFITHIDHGIGIYSGLEKIEVNGKLQEAVRLKYKDNDVLYVSIHSLHRISKYSGKEGFTPSLNKIGSSAWANLKNKTKQRLKDIAKDLIKLYAERKSKIGFAFSPDSYLQNELEASFIYEDTPDQIKSTADVKKDMEEIVPMDRLICGDVGFGKTEVAIRAAFKAVSDSKQVAVLVPTTILALQHYQTFSDRLKDFPCEVDYINRFKSTKEKTVILKKLKEGKIDILIGTHRLVSEDVKFKDLGLLIIDEEQKFGVAKKEKLKQIKVNVDTLTLTATPIPRTLQFSLMGARDLSLINTPPPNRYPIVTELHVYSESLIKEVVNFELNRGGQVFFVHNRVQNIMDIAALVKRLVPDAEVAVGHGQMDGKKLEEVMIGFVRGDFDVLVATTIIESGLDIPNANTIIINNAQNFGLSDLHQMRGRVGRSNKKAFCYLITPPLSTLTDEARRRLRAIEEFSDLGSGFNIAMRDLDIRGAGDIFGAEQSGFISDVGYDMYHKILDEAILELKENEYKYLFTSELAEEIEFVRECQLETDMELHIPTDYVYNIEERLSLYKELDSLEREEQLQAFSVNLKDRFGEIPNPTVDLFDAVRLRWYAKKSGFEKIILKGGIFIGYFVSNSESAYYEGSDFGNILQFVQNNNKISQMKESNGRLSLTIKNIKNISDALNVFNLINQNNSNPALV
ncbi:MAG: transcription-repair coupling factor [Bacteroidetes bacterium]|nr:transcription-repair coupling factor [Bacteroidota bacterium]